MELGSEYNLSLSKLTVTDNNIFSYLSGYKKVFYFDSGRSAIKHISEQLAADVKVLLPEFICESVSNCFAKEQIVYYRLDDNLVIDTDDVLGKMDNEQCIIFLMHYFGSLQPVNVLDRISSIASKTGSVIIEDTTHCIFTKSDTIGDYMVCSIRKWLPTPGGGVLYFNDNKLKLTDPKYPKSSDNLRSYGMMLKDLFLTEHFDCNTEYRRIFGQSEERLDLQTGLFEISDLSRFIASCVDIGELTKTRQSNYRMIRNAIMRLGIAPAVKYESSDIPLAVPIRVRERDKLRKYLENNNIYCAVHWPFDGMYPDQRPLAIRNAKELISLPMDQRYNKTHMTYMIDILEKYGGELSF